MGLTALAQTNFRPISFDEALAAAKQENKLVFIDFYTDWCGPCKKMAAEVFPQKKVGDFFNAKFVSVKYNAEKEGKELAARYVVKAYPTFVIVNAKGEVQLELKGSMGADDFIAKIANGLNPDMSPARMAERYKAGERTPELVNAYAMEQMQKRKEEEGFKIVNDYFASLTDAQRVAPENAFLYTRYTITLDDEKAKFMEVHRNEFAPAVKKEIMERIGRLYYSQLASYFSGYMLREGKYNEAEYQALKKKMTDLELDADGTYAPMFSLIESRAKNNDVAFLADCEKEFGKLSAQAQSLLIMNMDRLIQTNDKELLGKMSQFIRKRLGDLKPSVITVSGRMLENIESKMNAK